MHYAKQPLVVCLDDPGVLVHFDLWTSNAVMVAREDGSPSDQALAIIDWQMAVPGAITVAFTSE